MKYHAINHAGMLAVASDWFPHYDRPVMVRNIWKTKHTWDNRYDEMRLDASQPAWGGKQPWALVTCMGGQITFHTNEASDEVEEGERIKPPRKVRNQAHPWRYEAGQWNRHGTGGLSK